MMNLSADLKFEPFFFLFINTLRVKGSNKIINEARTRLL